MGKEERLHTIGANAGQTAHDRFTLDIVSCHFGVIMPVEISNAGAGSIIRWDRVSHRVGGEETQGQSDDLHIGTHDWIEIMEKYERTTCWNSQRWFWMSE